MIRFIETLYADPLLKFLVATTMRSFVIFAVAGRIRILPPSQIGGDARFHLEYGNRRMPYHPAAFSYASEVGGQCLTRDAYSI